VITAKEAAAISRPLSHFQQNATQECDLWSGFASRARVPMWAQSHWMNGGLGQIAAGLGSNPARIRTGADSGSSDGCSD